MVHFPQTLVNQHRIAAVCVLLCALSAGCVSVTPWMAKREQAPTGAPTQVVVTWEPRVVVTADTMNNGAPLPGLAGRMYLFDQSCGYPLAHDGCVHAELFDTCPLASGGQPVLLESWDIGPDQLKLLLRKDIIGWGYTLFLPWSTYNPTITNVQLSLCYKTKSGMPIYAPTAPMKLLDSNCPPPVVTRFTHTPGPAPVAQAATPPVAAASVQLLPPH